MDGAPREVKPGANVIDTCTGLTLVAKVDEASNPITVQIERVDISTDVKPIPLAAEAGDERAEEAPRGAARAAPRSPGRELRRAPTRSPRWRRCRRGRSGTREPGISASQRATPCARRRAWTR